MPNIKLLSFVLLALVLAGCQNTIPKEALQLSAASLEYRQLQTRVYETDEKNLLAASVGVMQDLGFNLDESETDLGLIVGSKERDATEAGQVAAAVFVALLGGGAMPIDKNQKLRISIVTEPVSDKKTKVRVTFQRKVWSTDGRLSKIEKMDEPEFYIGFFEKLSKSVFLEGHKI